MDKLHQHIEALVFSSESAVTVPEIVQALQRAFPGMVLDEKVVEQILGDLQQKFQSDIYAFELRVIGGGYQFFTKPAYHHTVAALIGMREKKRLSTAALETLAIIAYRGPITKVECEKIRGVNCDYSIEKLLEKELIEVAGRRDDAPGKPILYRVTQNFLDYFGINSTDDLPKLKEIVPPAENVVGAPPDIEISPSETSDADSRK
ncbi:MAG: SMC-Scp complex subunit ScpB [Chitinophagales bacterium]|nr:SMC-Scp complex subunit ScpB [Chitinophagales bacterium]MDW8419271.1 SMC-Scp complex subunit ScpB [Chitinophagales bacterium]